VFDAAIRRAGMLRVDTLQELFIAAETLAHFRGHRRATTSERADARHQRRRRRRAGRRRRRAPGLELAPLPPATRALDAVLPANWSHANPVDIIGDAPVSATCDALRPAADDPAPAPCCSCTRRPRSCPAPRSPRAAAAGQPAAPPRLLGCWLGGPRWPRRASSSTSRHPDYDTPEEAVRAFSMLAPTGATRSSCWRRRPRRRGPVAADLPRVRAWSTEVLADGREMLTEPEAKALLPPGGIPVVPTRGGGPTPRPRPRRRREAIGYPVALKILSPDIISHKSDVGGVALTWTTSRGAQRRRGHAARVRRLRPRRALEGFTVQAMVRRPQALELIVGASIDPLFGPVILFGQGGTAVEVVADRAVALPPLNAPLARALIARTRIARLLPAGATCRRPTWRRGARADHGVAAAGRRAARSPSSTSTRCWPTPRAWSRSTRACA
jgi:acetyltransferase